MHVSREGKYFEQDENTQFTFILRNSNLFLMAENCVIKILQFSLIKLSTNTVKY